MAQNVVINGVTYQDVPEVDIPKSGGGAAKFYDTAGAGSVTAADVLSGVTVYGANGAIVGSIPENGSTSGTISSYSAQGVAGAECDVSSVTISGTNMKLRLISGVNTSRSVTVRLHLDLALS